MEIGTTLYVKDRRQWRAWLARHHKTAPEIWRIAHVFDHESDTKRKLEWRVPPGIPAGPKKDRATGKHFQAVPPPDKKKPIGWVDAAPRRPGVFRPPPRRLPHITPPNKT